MLADLLRSSRTVDNRAALRQLHGGLDHKVAIVTGGDSPLARAVALCLAHNGADVVLVYRNEHGGVRDAMRRIQIQGAHAKALSGEIDDPEFAARVAHAVSDQLEQTDALLDDEPAVDTSRRARPERALRLAGNAIASFGEALRESLCAQGVQVRAMTQGPVWTPLVPTDPDTDLPVNQHRGNTGPCFVFVARRA
jgi:short-subunit dehydrogenase